MVIRDCQELCDYFCQLADVVRGFSYHISEDNEEKLDSKCLGDPTKCKSIRSLVANLQSGQECIFQSLDLRYLGPLNILSGYCSIFCFYEQNFDPSTQSLEFWQTL